MTSDGLARFVAQIWQPQLERQLRDITLLELFMFEAAVTRELLACTLGARSRPELMVAP